MPSLVTYPVKTLREQATTLGAALSVCVENAKPRAVHKLRTSTRRVEAQIHLLKELKGLPPHHKLGEKVLRQLAKVRREAGIVRDLDVQLDLLRAQAKKRSQQPDAKSDVEDHDEKHAQLRNEDFQRMIALRVERREDEAAKLLYIVKHRQTKIATALEQLLKALEPAESLKLPTPELIALAEKGFTKSRSLRTKKLSDDVLHSIRKAAKRVRYLTETSGARAAVETAKRYEYLQEAGGQWHDWFDLANAASKELGRKHIASSEFALLRDRRLVTYRTLLEAFR